MNGKNNRTGSSFSSIGKILLIALVLFILINLLFAITYPMNLLGRISLYNFIVPGRTRLPYGEEPTKSYNISLYNLDAMFSSHEIARRTKKADEFRVILIGDSSTWGFLLQPDETLSSVLNMENLTANGKKIHFYNFGYPVMSLTKDLLILSRAMSYEPDLILWLITLESFPKDKQLFPPLIQNNPSAVKTLINTYNLDLDPNSPSFENLSFYQKTIVGARKPLADLVRFQIYGIMWGATEIDQYIPETYEPKKEDLPRDDRFHNLEPPGLDENDLAFDVLQAGVAASNNTPILIINEPIFISHGENSDIRYNFYYPKWAYDDYRTLLKQNSELYSWNLLDLWNTISGTEFTNSAVHLSPLGTKQLSKMLIPEILSIVHQSY